MSRRTREPEAEIAIDPRSDAPGTPGAAAVTNQGEHMSASETDAAAPSVEDEQAAVDDRDDLDDDSDDSEDVEPDAVDDPVAANAAAIAELWRTYKSEGDPAVRE